LLSRKAVIVFSFSLLAFAPYFFRETLVGTDPYEFLAKNCLAPCNVFPFQAFLFFLMAVSCLSIAWLGARLTKNGWLAGLFVFCSPTWLMSFWNLENEIAGYALSFAGLALFFGGKSNKTRVLGVLACVFGVVVWLGAFIGLLGLSTISIPWFIGLLFAGSTIFYNQIGNLFIKTIMPTLKTIQENYPGWGALYNIFLMNGLTQLKRIPKLIWPTVFFFAIAMLNLKYSLYATFFLSIYLVEWWNSQNDKVSKALPFAVAAIVTAFMCISVFSLPPDSQELDATRLAVNTAAGETIYNDWSTGYWIEWYGGVPYAKAGGDWNIEKANGVVLDYKEHDCKQLNEKGVKLKVYLC
jgi:hypothetical protein